MLTLREANKENPYNLEERLLISRGYLDYSNFMFLLYFPKKKKRLSTINHIVLKEKYFRESN